MPFNYKLITFSNVLLCLDFLQSSPEVLTKENLKKYVKSIYDWHCVSLNNSKAPTYFLSILLAQTI